MPPIAALSETLTLRALRDRYGLTSTDDPAFFLEWQEPLPELNAAEFALVNRLRQRYRYYLEEDLLLEEGIKVMLVSPLLEAAGLFDAPFRSRFEEAIALEALSDDPEPIVYRGRLDTLVIHDRLWVMVIEAKRMRFSLENGLAQILAYMLANPLPDRPLFGLLTNGSHYRFLKMQKTGAGWRYAKSDEFLVERPGELEQVLGILKRLAGTVLGQ